MALRIIKILIGCLVLYFMGWFVNYRTPDGAGFKVPKIISFICGKKQPFVTAGGLVLQLIAIGYSIGGLIGALVIKKENLINFFGVSTTLLVIIICFVIWGIWRIIQPKV
jgi:hypothetical protein